METGYLLVINTKNGNESIKLTNHLIGRVTKVKDKDYYYPGILNNIKFSKITRGVYFITKSIPQSDKYILMGVEGIDIDETQLKTGKEYWSIKNGKNQE